MAVLLSAPSKNAIQKELAAQLLSTAGNGDPITFDDVDGIPNLPGVLVIRRIDANGESTPSFREYIEYSGTSGSTVIITTRNVDGSNAALTHPVGSIVEFIPDVVWADRIYDALSVLVDVSDISVLNSSIVTLTGTQTLTNKTLTSPRIGGALLTSATLSGIIAGNATLPGWLALNDVQFGSRKTTIYNNGNAGPSLSINLNNGESQRVTLATNATLTLANVEEGDYLSLYVIQASGASATVTFAQPGGSVRNVNATIPQIRKSNNAVNLIGIRAFNASISDVVAVSSNLA